MRPTNDIGLVSVVIPCRNESPHVRRLIRSLMEQETTGFGVEFLIADGMSDDGTREILSSEAAADPRIRIIDNPGRIVSTGLNAAIRGARGDIIVRMDAHTEYARDYIARCVETLIQTGADNVGGAPRVRADSFRLQVLGAAYHSPFAVGGARSHNFDYEGYVDSVFYGCWHKSTLDRLGLFDEELVRNQDDELNLRLIRRGGKVWQSRNIVCWYRPRTTLGSLWRQYLQYGFWKVAVIRKHRIPASWRHLPPALFVAAAAGLPCAAGLAWAGDFPQLAVELLRLWLLMLSVYSLASIVAALWAARRWQWRVAPVLPLVFAIYHVSYGVGFLLGLVFWTLNGTRPAGSAVTALTR
jgi:glycosyltransferase involved in cell wall biosynthesis